MTLCIVQSSRSQPETLARLRATIERRGLTVFAHVDHAAGAAAVGLELPEEDVLLFGDPRAGTPLMQEDARVGLDLPLRMLVWRGSDGAFVAYHDPRDLASELELGEHRAILERMAQLLHDLTREATE